jgi:hypothetical protein
MRRSITVTAQPAYFRYDGKGYYSFYDYDDEDYLDPTPREIADGAGRTDDSGHYLIDLTADLGDKPFTQTYRIEATVRDASGYTVTGRTQVVVHPGQVYVGAQPERYVNSAGRESRIDVIAVDWDSQPVADQRINVAVVERRWNNVQEMDSLGRTTWVWEAEDIPVTRGRVTTDAEGRAVQLHPPKAGVYRITLSTRDEDGNAIRSAVTTWVAGKEYVRWRQRNDNRIDLIPDQDSYRRRYRRDHDRLAVPGAAHARDRRAPVSSGRKWSRWIATPTSTACPSRRLRAQRVRQRDAGQGRGRAQPDGGLPHGLIQLQVDTEQKEITVEISADREQVAPGETVRHRAHERLPRPACAG